MILINSSIKRWGEEEDSDGIVWDDTHTMDLMYNRFMLERHSKRFDNENQPPLPHHL